MTKTSISDIRKLDPEEQFDAKNLIREVFFDSLQFGFSQEGANAYRDYITGLEGEYLGAFAPDLCGVLVYDPDSYILKALYVRMEMQKKGIGTELVHCLAAEAEKMHIARVETDVPSQAVNVLACIGFEPAGSSAAKNKASFTPMEYLTDTNMLGKEVTVIVDHPYGSLHPSLPDVLLPVNYGYVDLDLSSDAEFQNAYIYGPIEPVEEYKGRVIGILYRKNDNTSRWIVSNRKDYNKDAILAVLSFAEQYYDTRLEWEA